MEESKRDKFKRLANRRVNNALKHIKMVGNLSDHSRYEYSDEDVEKIFKFIDQSVDEAKAKFAGKQEKESFHID